MGNRKKEHGTIGLMILTVIIIFCVIAIIVGGFRMIKKNEDAKLAAASDTEYIENKQDREELQRQEEQDKEEAEEAEKEIQDTEKTVKSQADSETQESGGTKNSFQSQTDADKQEANDTDSQKTDKSDGTSQTDTDFDAESNMAVSSDSDEEVEEQSSEDDKVYLIKGDEKSSNRYEKAKHLSYTTTVKYTPQDLSLLDSYGLKITRNEIYARHGRMFNDRDLQEYFQRQKWYVPQTASNDFDNSCLNEVERYNIELIKTYEQQVGGR